MDKLLSIIIVVENEQECDLSVALSSINNQIGIDFSAVEVLLIDNGAYKLQAVQQLQIFNRMQLEYVRLPRRVEWEDAFQTGVEMATGKYVMFMSSDTQINQAGALQTYFGYAGQNQEADVISGLVMTEQVDDNLQTSYHIGRDQLSVRGRWFRRSFLRDYDIRFRSSLRPFADEYVCRLVKLYARDEVQFEDIVLTKFAARNADALILGTPAHSYAADWLMMMTTYLNDLSRRNQAVFVDEFARFVIRFYSRLQLLRLDEQGPALQAMRGIVIDNERVWRDVILSIRHIISGDKTPVAPWNQHRAAFTQYVNRLTGYLRVASVRTEI